jgi:DnaK suppressor protein
MSELTAAQTAQFKETLMTRRDEYVDRIGTLQEEMQRAEEQRDPGDEGDSSQHMEHRKAMLTELKRIEGQLNQTRKALARFDGDFGYCDECGEDIPLARLTFNPAIITCVHCQSIIENKNKHRAA